jgi:hypothetical protein
MQQYLMGLFTLALCCAVVELLAPAGEGGGIARHIKLMSALCLLCTLISPLISLLQNGGELPKIWEDWFKEWTDTDENTEQWEDRWQEESEGLDIAYAQLMVADMIREEFGLEASDVRVELLLDEDEGSVKEARVALTGKAIWVDTHAMETYIKDTFGWQSTIYME